MSFVYTALVSESSSRSSLLRTPRLYLTLGLSAILLLLVTHLALATQKVQWPLLGSTSWFWDDHQVDGREVSELANYLYWNETGYKSTMQNQDAEGYTDHLVQHPEDTPPKNRPVLKKSRRRAIILPTFPGHYHQALLELRSLQCLCTDIQDFDIVAVLSNRYEALEFKDLGDEYLGRTCPQWFGRFEVKTQEKPLLNMRYVNMFDILPESLKIFNGVSENTTEPLLATYGKYKYQGIKKLQTTRHFSYSHVLWLDSEGVAVQPFSMTDLFDKYIAEPIVWTSRYSWMDPFMSSLMWRSADLLGRSMGSFGQNYWNVESLQWIIDREIVEDMFLWVERVQGRSFWDMFLNGGEVFECTLYYLHIAARKLETVNSIFSKYRILETERELMRFGLGPAIQWRPPNGPPGGLLEYIGTLLMQPDSQPKISAFLGHYNHQLIRIKNLNYVDRTTMERLLLNSPVSMLVSDDPGMHKWWNWTFSDPEPSRSSNNKEQKLEPHVPEVLYDPSWTNVP